MGAGGGKGSEGYGTIIRMPLKLVAHERLDCGSAKRED